MPANMIRLSVWPSQMFNDATEILRIKKSDCQTVLNSRICLKPIVYYTVQSMFPLNCRMKNMLKPVQGMSETGLSFEQNLKSLITPTVITKLCRTKFNSLILKLWKEKCENDPPIMAIGKRRSDNVPRCRIRLPPPVRGRVLGEPYA